MQGCPFCLKNNSLRVGVMYEDDLWYVTGLDPQEPSNAALVITKRHVSDPFAINYDEWSALRELLAKVKGMLDDREEPQGYNIGWNVGSTGGQTVPHAHLHVVARYDDEEMANKGIRHHFKAVRNKRLTR